MKEFPKILLSAIAILSLAVLGARAETRPDLTGTVAACDGTPIAGASVFIYTAGPKQGTSSLCPSCYADCQKQAQSDAGGRFKIEALDPALQFRLLVVSAGYESRFVSKVDPAKGAPAITLKPLDPEALKSPLRIKGLVINEQGKPVPGAIVSAEGVGIGPMTRWGGTDDYVEPMAIADVNGHFALFCKTNTVDEVHATASGRGAAKQWVTLKPGGDYLVRLPEGVSLTGAILRDGRPLTGIAVTATTKDRACGVFFNLDAVSTDKDGRFLLPNVPPGREFIVSATMKSLNGNGALPDTIITTGDSGSVQDLGKLEVKPAFTVAGRIVLSDGQPVPADTRLFLGRNQAMDSQEVKLGPAGQFEFKGVPAESVTLAVRINGYSLSRRNPSLDWLNGQILGRVSGDVTGLTLLMEPGNWRPDRDERPVGVDEYPQDKPLRGVKL
jgi:hypothetical protein